MQAMYDNLLCPDCGAVHSCDYGYYSVYENDTGFYIYKCVYCDSNIDNAVELYKCEKCEKLVDQIHVTNDSVYLCDTCFSEDSV